MDCPRTRCELQLYEPELFAAVEKINPHGAELLRTKADLEAFWMLMRLTSPTYMSGLICRYNNVRYQPHIARALL